MAVLATAAGRRLDMDAVLVLVATLLGGGGAPQSTAAPAGPETAPTQAARSVPGFVPFHEGGKDGLWGYMDSQGKVVIKPKYRSADYFCGGRALVWLGQPGGDANGYAYIDEQDRPVFRLPRGCYIAGRFVEGMAYFEIGNRYGFHDRDGKVVVPPTYDEVRLFSEGLAPVNRGAKRPRFPGLRGPEGGKWGYIDKTGREVIALQFDYAGLFSEGLALVGTAGRYAYIDPKGKTVLTIENLKPDSPRWHVESAYGFSEGLARFHTKDGEHFKGAVGFIDKTGKLAFPYQFSDAGDFSEGLAAVSDGYKWGYMDKAGRTVIKHRFDEARRFSEGLAAVRIGKAWGYVNRQGALVVDPRRNEDLPGPINRATFFSGGIAEVHVGGKLRVVVDGPWYWGGGAWYYINRQGQIVRQRHTDDEVGEKY
jgi:hypothetical protein